MTKDNLVTVSEGISLEDSKKLLHEHRIEKLLVVDQKGRLTGSVRWPAGTGWPPDESGNRDPRVRRAPDGRTRPT